MKQTPLKRRKGIRKQSKKREAELNEEREIRRQLCERAGGHYIPNSGVGRCVGGLCEICHKPPDWRGLCPHEEPFRSHGGKVSLKDSKMACGKCHSKPHGIKEVDSQPQWSKK